MRVALETQQGVISSQVIQECTTVLLKKIPSPLGVQVIQKLYVQTLFPLCHFEITLPSLYEKALALKQRYGFSFYDSLIVAAAVFLQCDTLYTEDLQHTQRIEGVRIVNLFIEPLSLS